GREPTSGSGRLHGQVALDTIFRDVLTGQRISDLEKVDGNGESLETPKTQATPDPEIPDPETPDEPTAAAEPGAADEPAAEAGGAGQVRAPRTRRLRPRRHRGPGRGGAPRCGGTARRPVPPEPGAEHHVPALPRPRTDAPLVPPQLRRTITSRTARRLGEARFA